MSIQIDCDSCEARPVACGDCIMSVLLVNPSETKEWFDDDEQRAIVILAEKGLVPPLRMATRDRNLA